MPSSAVYCSHATAQSSAADSFCSDDQSVVQFRNGHACHARISNVDFAHCFGKFACILSIPKLPDYHHKILCVVVVYQSGCIPCTVLCGYGHDLFGRSAIGSWGGLQFCCGVWFAIESWGVVCSFVVECGLQFCRGVWFAVL